MELRADVNVSELRSTQTGARRAARRIRRRVWYLHRVRLEWHRYVNSYVNMLSPRGENLKSNRFRFGSPCEAPTPDAARAASGVSITVHFLVFDLERVARRVPRAV